MFERSNLLETILQVLQGREKVFDESPITIAIFFEKDYGDGNWRLINCLSLEVNGPPWILRYPWRGSEPGESRIIMPCGDLNYVLRVCSSTGSTDILWSNTRTGVGQPCRTVGASVSHIIDLTGLQCFSVLFLVCLCSSPRTHHLPLNH